MIEIYHNPRCRKSREGLALLESSGREFKVVKYLDQPPSQEELSNIINKLGIKPLELVRKNEAIWKQNYKNRELDDDEIIAIMSQNPKLIERPIVILKKKAVIGRPSEVITQFLEKN